METVWLDLRYGARMLARNPGFTIVAVLTLALGIGPTTAVYSAVHAVLLQPLPFKDEHQLVRLFDVRQRDNGEVSWISHSQRNFFAVRDQAQSFESVTAQVYQEVALDWGGGPERIVCIGVSQSWLDTLGIQPLLGREFNSEEEKTGSDSRVVLVSHRLWQQRFGLDSNALGKTLLLDNQRYTIVGVLPRGFRYPYDADLWRPWTFDPHNGRQHLLNTQARLKADATRAQAQAELDTLSERLAREFPETNLGYHIRLRPTRDDLVGNNDKTILVLFAGVSFLLLIACVNVANLLLVRAQRRQKEFALRTALGASPWRQAQQLLTENLLLSMTGGTLGVLFASWSRDFLLQLIPSRLGSVLETVEINLAVLGFALLLSAGLSVLVSLLPVLQGMPLDLQGALRDRSGSHSTKSRSMNVLVVGEIALALVLLTGATLMGHNLYRLQRRDLGFSSENLLTLVVALPESSYALPQPRIQFIQQARERIEALPGVEAAGVVNIFPLTDGNRLAPFIREGELEELERSHLVNHRVTTPGYLEAMKVPLLRGRLITEQDTASEPAVVVISRSLARRYWPEDDPIGKRVRMVASGAESPWMTVIGVVGDVVEPRTGDGVQETWYLPYAQSLETSTAWSVLQPNVVIRTHIEATTLAESVKKALWAVDRAVPVYGVRTVEDFYAETLSPKWVSATLILFFSGFGLVLATLGIYGVMSYRVAQRTHEFGVRMALGASPRDILKLVMKQGTWLVLGGLSLGLGGASICSRFLATVVSEVAVIEPVTYLGVALLLAGVALAACYIPARRATRVEPLVALRYE
ncbi:MAG: ABC transporter permease [Candidatus Acidiferrales bacterium]